LFVFYDFETTGTSPAFDQPLQFAAILTDGVFQPQGRVDIRCRLSPGILPAPWALAVTGVDPATLTDPAHPSLFEFMQTIGALIADWGSATWVGYNSIDFDEPMMRQAFYQNLHPSIYRTQRGGHDRMDVMKLVYSTWELARDALEWPLNDKDKHSFKLEHLASANGFDQHNTHDALGDVEATIHLASLICQRAPGLWKQALRNRNKPKTNTLLEAGQPLRLVERFGGPPRSYAGAFAGRNPENPNTVGFLDLEAADPETLAAADDDALLAAVDDSPKLIRSVKVNGFPSLYPDPELTPEITNRARTLAAMPEFRERVGKALAARYADRPEPEHVEEQIYSQFATDADQYRLRQFQVEAWEDRLGLLREFGDQRYFQLGRRLIYEHRPDLLDDSTRAAMVAAIQERWHAAEAPWTTFADVDHQIEEIRQAGAMNDEPLEALQVFYDVLRAEDG
jgi:exodeoxyribonuclease-1